MIAAENEPLGFSDLTEDEGFLVVLYRDWQRRGPTRAVAEHALARLLRSDKVYPVLDAIFVTFDDWSSTNVEPTDPGVLLTAEEEALLTRLAEIFRQRMKLLPGPDAMDVRAAEEIVRSGHDRLNAAIDRAYWQTVAMQVAEKDRIH
ncbi:MAG: hypothetical protein AAF713_16000 [Pseudomonadota bacterium]